jgi:hypothetical protein
MKLLTHVNVREAPLAQGLDKVKVLDLMDELALQLFFKLSFLLEISI